MHVSSVKIYRLYACNSCPYIYCSIVSIKNILHQTNCLMCIKVGNKADEQSDKTLRINIKENQRSESSTDFHRGIYF